MPVNFAGKGKTVNKNSFWFAHINSYNYYKSTNKARKKATSALYMENIISVH